MIVLYRLCLSLLLTSSPLTICRCNNKYQIIMAEELELPKISTETREKIRAMGFVNHLYDSTNLPSAYIPRGCGFNALTYAVMGFSLVGAVFAKRLSFEPTTFIFTFLAAPTMAFIQKKEADTLFFSQFSKQNPATILARYPLLNQSYKQVSQEVDTEISSAKERIRLLEEHSRRSSN